MLRHFVNRCRSGYIFPNKPAVLLVIQEMLT